MKATKVKPDEQFARLLELSSLSGATSDPAMMPLAALAGALRTAGATAAPAGPDPEFRAALRQRLVAVATVQAADPTTARASARGGLRTRAQARVAALAGTVAVLTSVAGVGVAAARSLPGDPFYGVKRATESVQLWTARGDVAKGKRHLEFARTRLAEAQKLSPTSSHLASTLAAMNTQTTDGTNELIAAATSSHSTAPLADLTSFTQAQVSGLVRLATTLPATLPATARVEEQRSLAELSSVVKQVQTVAHGRCVTCGPGQGPTNPIVIPPLPAPNGSSPGTGQGGGKSTGRHGGQRHPGQQPSGQGSPRPQTSRSPGVPGSTPSSPSIIPPLPTRVPSLPSLGGLLGGGHGSGHHKHAGQTKGHQTPDPLSTLLGGLGL